MAAPKRHPVDQLRTRVWCAVVKSLSGLTAREIGRVLPGNNQPSPDGVDRMSTWPKYEVGDRIPRVGRSPFPVEEAERHWPGSRAYFDAHIWMVLKGMEKSRAGSEFADLLESPDELGRFEFTMTGPARYSVDISSSLSNLSDQRTFAALSKACLLVAALVDREGYLDRWVTLSTVHAFDLEHDPYLPADMHDQVMIEARGWIERLAQQWGAKLILLGRRCDHVQEIVYETDPLLGYPTRFIYRAR